MKLSEMKTRLEFYIDDISDMNIAVGLFNTAKDRMATEVKATFPDIVAEGDNSTSFSFDPAFHEVPVLYAAAMYKSADSSINEKNSYMTQFEAGVVRFVSAYKVPIEFRNDEVTEQHIATDGQTDFVITKDGFYPRFTRLRVYINGVETHNYEWIPDLMMIMIPSGLTTGDKLTISWESNDVWTHEPAFYPKGW